MESICITYTFKLKLIILKLWIDLDIRTIVFKCDNLDSFIKRIFSQFVQLNKLLLQFFISVTSNAISFNLIHDLKCLLD